MHLKVFTKCQMLCNAYDDMTVLVFKTPEVLQDTNSPIRPRLGSATTSSPPSRPTPLTKRHVQSIRPTTPATSAVRWHSTGRMTDGTGDRNTALCCLTPAPRTKWRGGSSPGPSSLGISMKDQPFVLRLVRDPPAGPRTYFSFSASSETPRQGLGCTIPSPPRPRPGSSRILVASTSTVPLASRHIRLSAPGHTYYVSHDWQGTATGAMGQLSNLLFTIPY